MKKSYDESGLIDYIRTLRKEKKHHTRGSSEKIRNIKKHVCTN